MPNDINARVSKFAELCSRRVNQYGRSASNLIGFDDDIILGLASCDKICYYPEESEISGTKTFKVPSFGGALKWQVESLKKWLDKRYIDNSEVLCFLGAFTSPTIYNPLISEGSKSLMIRGAFIKVSDDFILPKIVDRNKRIDTILDETK